MQLGQNGKSIYACMRTHTQIHMQLGHRVGRVYIHACIHTYIHAYLCAVGPEWQEQWLRDHEDQKEWDIQARETHERYLAKLKQIYVDPPPSRDEDENAELIAKYGPDDGWGVVSGDTSSEISESNDD
jgi:hypothetical protein